MLVGLEGTGPEGGGWRGLVVTYVTDGGATHRLEVPVEMLMCGSDTEPCAEVEN